MSLTFSHPAAVLPLARTGLSFSALVIGSMSPDFVYFVTFKTHGAMTHSLPGIFLYCLPSGFLVYLVYHLVAKEPLLSLMGRPSSRTVVPSERTLARRPLRKAVLVALSLVVGACTHVVWDAFTHENSRVIQLLPLVRSTVFDVGFDTIPLTRLLHHAGSVGGALCLMTWTRSRLRETRGEDRGATAGDPRRPRGFRTIALWFVVSAVAGLVFAWLQVRPVQGFDDLRLMSVRSLVAAGSALFSISFLYSLCWHVKQGISPPKVTASTERSVQTIREIGP
jgi:hypothetical protein